jgi:putative ABC transport system permease protein
MFTFRFAWRDSRSSRRRLLLFVSAMALGVAALVAIRSFSDQMQEAVEAQAKELAGADMNVWVRRPLTPADEAFLDSLRVATSAEVSRQLVFTSMAYFPATGGSRLSQVQAIEGGFPFYGDVVTEPADAAYRYQAAGEALVDASLLLQMEAAPGDSVRVGRRTYRIAGRLDALTGQPDIAAFIAPRVVVPIAGLDTMLLSFGSRVEVNTYFRLPETLNPSTVVTGMRPELRRLGLQAWSAAGVQADWSESLGDLSRFLALVGFVALLLGGIGVASAVTVYVRQQEETVATLRCLGADAGLALRVYLLQAATLGLLAALLGAALGIGVQALLPAVLGPFLPVDVPFGVSWPAVATGVGVGLAVALGFALLPLLRVRRIPPLAAIRPDAARSLGGDPWRWAVVLALGAGVGAFAWAQTGRADTAIAFPLALAVALGVLALIARGVMAGVRRAFPRGLPFAWRQGLANLYRPGNQTLVLLTTLGLGTGLLLTLYLIQATLLGRIALPAGGGERPGLILFDIQSDQVEAVEGTLRAEGAPVLQRAPVVSMRVAAVNGRRVAEADTAGGRAGWAVRREWRSTYRDHLVDSERLVAGTFTGSISPAADVIPISLTADIAEELGVELGDRVTWDVAGLEVESEVGSLREVDWARVQPNFFAVFPEGPLNDAPQNHIVLTRTDGAESDAALQRTVVRAFPNISVVDVRLVVDLIEGVLGRVAFVLQFMALFALGTGLVVLAGAVRVSRLQRIEETVLLRTLGADRGEIRRILIAEYLLLGLLAAVVGAALALAAAGALAAFVFDAPLVPAWGAMAIALVGVPLLTVAVGLVGSRGILARPPLEVLRAAG